MGGVLELVNDEGVVEEVIINGGNEVAEIDRNYITGLIKRAEASKKRQMVTTMKENIGVRSKLFFSILFCSYHLIFISVICSLSQSFYYSRLKYCHFFLIQGNMIRVGRKVSTAVRQQIAHARGDKANRICGSLSSSRRTHAQHVASHFTAFSCQCCGWTASRLTWIQSHQRREPSHHGVVEIDQPPGFVEREAGVRRLEDRFNT